MSEMHRLTDHQFRALLSAKYHGSAAFAPINPKRTLPSLARLGYIEPQPPWRLTPEGDAAIDRATGRNQPVQQRTPTNAE